MIIGDDWGGLDEHGLIQMTFNPDYTAVLQTNSYGPFTISIATHIYMLNAANDFVFSYFKLALLNTSCVITYHIDLTIKWDKCFERAGNTQYP